MLAQNRGYSFNRLNLLLQRPDLITTTLHNKKGIMPGADLYWFAVPKEKHYLFSMAMEKREMA